MRPVSFLRTFIYFLQRVSVSGMLLLCHLRNMTCTLHYAAMIGTVFFLEFLMFSKHSTKVFKKHKRKNVVKSAKLIWKCLIVLLSVSNNCVVIVLQYVPDIFFVSETFLHMYCPATLEVLSQLALLTSGHSFVDDCS